MGVTLDDSLNWSAHISKVRGKVSRGLGILCKARKKLNRDTVKTLYYSFIFPYLLYCCEVWGKTFDIYLRPLEILQKRAIRIIAGVDRRSSTACYFQSLNILPLGQLYMYTVSLFMYKYYHGLLPNSFKSFFAKNSDTHSYLTRHSEMLSVPKFQHNFICKTNRSKIPSATNNKYPGSDHKCKD